MKRKKYILSFKIGVQESLEYRMDFALSIISIFFVVAMQFFMWRAIYAENTEGLFTYSYVQMLMYTLFANLVSRITMIDLETAQCIKSGDLSKYLIKPVNYFFNTVAYCMGKRSTIMAVLTTLILAAIVYFQKILSQPIEAWRILLFFITVALGLAINILINFIISIATFWFTDVNNLFSTIYIVQLLLSGGIFPLHVFGSVLVTVSRVLPFQYTIQFPIDILTGKISGTYLSAGIGVQLFWIAFCSAAGYHLWRRGLKRYMAVEA